MKTTLTYIKSSVWFAKLVVWFFQWLLPFIFLLLVSLTVHAVSLCSTTISSYTEVFVFLYVLWVCGKISFPGVWFFSAPHQFLQDFFLWSILPEFLVFVARIFLLFSPSFFLCPFPYKSSSEIPTSTCALQIIFFFFW